MELENALFFLFPGLLALAFDCRAADAMNRFSSQLSEYIPAHLKWPNAVRPGSRASFENFLFFIRWWGVSMTLFGIGLGVCSLFGR